MVNWGMVEGRDGDTDTSTGSVQETRMDAEGKMQIQFKHKGHEGAQRKSRGWRIMRIVISPRFF